MNTDKFLSKAEIAFCVMWCIPTFIVTYVVLLIAMDIWCNPLVFLFCFFVFPVVFYLCGVVASWPLTNPTKWRMIFGRK